MARMKNGSALRKIHPDKLMVKPKVKPDWGHKRAALQALEAEAEPYVQPRTLGKNGVEIVGKQGFRIDDATGRAAIAQFRRPGGTPSYYEVFGKDKPEKRSVGENVMILRAHMHLRGLPPIDEREPMTTFATVFARFVLPRRCWPLFSAKQVVEATAFIAEWASRLYGEVAKAGPAKPQAVLPGWALPDRAAFYNPEIYRRGR